MEVQETPKPDGTSESSSSRIQKSPIHRTNSGSPSRIQSKLNSLERDGEQDQHRSCDQNESSTAPSASDPVVLWKESIDLNTFLSMMKEKPNVKTILVSQEHWDQTSTTDACRMRPHCHVYVGLHHSRTLGIFYPLLGQHWARLFSLAEETRRSGDEVSKLHQSIRTRMDPLGGRSHLCNELCPASKCCPYEEDGGNKRIDYLWCEENCADSEVSEHGSSDRQADGTQASEDSRYRLSIYLGPNGDREDDQRECSSPADNSEALSDAMLVQ